MVYKPEEFRAEHLFTVAEQISFLRKAIYQKKVKLGPVQWLRYCFWLWVDREDSRTFRHAVWGQVEGLLLELDEVTLTTIEGSSLAKSYEIMLLAAMEGIEDDITFDSIRNNEYRFLVVTRQN